MVSFQGQKYSFLKQIFTFCIEKWKVQTAAKFVKVGLAFQLYLIFLKNAIYFVPVYHTCDTYTQCDLPHTPQLNEKYLSTNSPWDFAGGLVTIKPNWVCPENRFAAKSTWCGAIYWWKNDIPSNMLNQKTNATYFTNFLRPSTLLLCKKVIC